MRIDKETEQEKQQAPNAVRHWESMRTGWRRARDRAYRLCYGTGIQTARAARFVIRRGLRTLRPVGRGLRLAADKLLVRHIRALREECRRIRQGFSLARARLAEAVRRHPLRVIPAALSLPVLAARRHRRALISFGNLAAPVAAALVLVFTVQFWTTRTFGLVLEYDGQTLGYIADEKVYENAAAMAAGRVIQTDESFRLERVPKLTLAVVSKEDMLDETALCDQILRTSGDSIAQASGLYIDGVFEGSVESRAELDGLLQGILQAHVTDPVKEKAAFLQTVEVVEGLYPISSLVTAEELERELTAPATTEKTVTVDAGDTLGGVAKANSMSLGELRSLNPAVESTDMVKVGQKLLVRREVPYLQVKVLRTITYTEEIAYTTQTVQDTSKYMGYEAIKTAGKKGSRRVTAEVTLVNGEEQSRSVITSEVTKNPVTQVKVVGAKKYDPSTQLGDGKATGRFIWPVPGYTNIYSPFGNKRGSKYHQGIDISQGGIKGKAIVAADGGRVVEANSTSWWGQGYGYSLVIDHGNGYRTRYAHCEKINVKVGQKVAQGQLVGWVGSSGNSSGYHLHFELLINGRAVNPVPYIKKK